MAGSKIRKEQIEDLPEIIDMIKRLRIEALTNRKILEYLRKKNNLTFPNPDEEIDIMSSAKKEIEDDIARSKTRNS